LPERGRKYLFLLLLALGLFWVYSGSLHHDFTHWDDQEQVVQNTAIRSLSDSGLTAIFTTPVVGMYQPLTTLLYACIYHLFGSESFYFHLASLLLHAFNCLLVFQLLRHFRLRENLAFLLTAIFAFHPMQVESVAWVSAFSTLLFSCLFLLATLYYLKFLEKSRPAFYALTLFFFLLACLAKSAAVVFPLLLIACDWYYFQNYRTIRWKNKIPFLAISLVFGIITVYTREDAGHLSDLSVQFNIIERLFLSAYALLFYPFKFVFPFQLSAYYPFPVDEQENLSWLPWLSLPILILGLFMIAKKTTDRLIHFGLLFYLITVVLIIQLVPLGNQIAADRYIYVPMIGLMLAVAPLLSTLKVKYIYILLIIPILMAWMANQRTIVWQNDKTLWTDVLEKHPSLAQAHNNLGAVFMEEIRYSQALSHFHQAIESKPYYADAYANRGNVYSQTGKPELALADLNRAIQLKPHADAYFNRANIFSQMGKPKEAITDYTASLDLKKSPDAYTNRAFAYLKMENTESALADLNAAIQLDNTYAPAFYLRGMLAARQKQYDSACADFKQANKLGSEAANKALDRFCKN
jgi:tetratricopeptide (TPR) repeat protein